jgi:cupin 2 domain-containing protein
MIRNLLTGISDRTGGELFERLLETRSFRLERIVSTGQATPPGQWYDQERDEWVLLVSGEARLLFEDEAEARVLLPGDHILIPAHRRHRVEWTAPGSDTIWLALHFDR